MKVVDGGGQRSNVEPRSEKLVRFLASEWDVRSSEECENMAYALLGALGALASVWNPYAVIGLLFANASYILEDIEEEELDDDE